MKSYDYDAVAYDGAIYCTGCLPGEAPADEVMPIFADSETDSYPVCDVCGTEHDYMSLTAYGRAEYARRRKENFRHALIHFCADYHSGQWSRGYRILCRALRLIGDRRSLDRALNDEGRGFYWALEQKFIDRV